jgi:aminoglycoside 3-N-acetyltransferase
VIKYKCDEFSSGLTEVGILKGDVLNIHSSIFTFGIPSDCKIIDVPKNIFKILFEIIGTEGTIAVPAFNFDFCKGVPFNRQTTPPKLMGSFSEYVFSLKESIRSFHPMQSVSVIGKYADEITKNDTSSSFEEHGPWATLEKLEAKVVLLGSDFKSPSIFHMVEEREQVPYRYWKSFPGKYIDNGEESERTYKMYVRELEPSPLLNLSSLEQLLVERNLIRYAYVGTGRISCFLASDFIACAKEKIRINPYYFVSNHTDYLKEN